MLSVSLRIPVCQIKSSCTDISADYLDWLTGWATPFINKGPSLYRYNAGQTLKAIVLPLCVYSLYLSLSRGSPSLCCSSIYISGSWTTINQLTKTHRSAYVVLINSPIRTLSKCLFSVQYFLKTGWVNIF